MGFYSDWLNKQKAKARVFISFDYDHDADLKNLLVGQARNEDSPFEIADWSIKEELACDWKEKVRERIRNVTYVIVICGEHTDTASGVSTELRITQDESKYYFLLWGRPDKHCVRPTAASTNDKIYECTWKTLGSLLNGNR